MFKTKIIKRSFSLKDQSTFSKLSGDFNPIHLNKEYARRSIAGKPLIHGVNLVFWALNEFLKLKKKEIEIQSINIIFNKFAFCNNSIKLKIIEKKKNIVEFLYYHEDLLSSVILKYKFKKTIQLHARLNKIKKIKPADLDTSQKIDNKVFTEDILINKKILKKKYVYLSKYLNLRQTIDLVTITRFIGMKVPGLNSILYSLSLNLFKKNHNSLSFKISKFDKRFNLIEQSFFGLSLAGNIKTLIRPNIKQENFNNKVLKIKKKQFSHQKALIIGGSKGLGEAVVKILSHGFADIMFSFNTGKKDAFKIKSKNNKKIKIFYLNVEKKLNLKQIKLIQRFKPTHFYYFATPKIFTGEAYNFDVKKFNLFNQYYLSSFNEIFKVLDKVKLKAVFSPSSISVNEPTSKLFEYSCSKSAMETYFVYLKSKYRYINFYFPRLLKIRTNQTISVFNEKLKSPYFELIKYLKKIG